jgi:hypothetical protein
MASSFASTATSPAMAAGIRAVKRVRAQDGGGGPSPTESPVRLPGNAGAGRVAGGSGGGGSGVWSAILLCCVLWLAQVLRPHPVRVCVADQSGFVSLLQRPG